MPVRHPYGIVQCPMRYMRVEIKKEFWDGDENSRSSTQVIVKATRMHEADKSEHEEDSRIMIQKQKR